MRPFERKYSVDERDAIVLAIVDGKLSAAEACKRAARGELPDAAGDLLPAFEFNPRTASEYAKLERDRRRGQLAAGGTPDEQIDASCERTVAMAAYNLDRLDNRRRRGQKGRPHEHTKQELERIRAYLGIMREAAATLRRVAPTSQKTAKQPAAEPRDDTADSELMRRARLELQRHERERKSSHENGTAD